MVPLARGWQPFKVGGQIDPVWVREEQALGSSHLSSPQWHGGRAPAASTSSQSSTGKQLLSSATEGPHLQTASNGSVGCRLPTLALSSISDTPLKVTGNEVLSIKM